MDKKTSYVSSGTYIFTRVLGTWLLLKVYGSMAFDAGLLAGLRSASVPRGSGCPGMVWPRLMVEAIEDEARVKRGWRPSSKGHSISRPPFCEVPDSRGINGEWMPAPKVFQYTKQAKENVCYFLHRVLLTSNHASAAPSPYFSNSPNAERRGFKFAKESWIITFSLTSMIWIPRREEFPRYFYPMWNVIPICHINNSLGFINQFLRTLSRCII